jgi:hypothetical protein
MNMYPYQKVLWDKLSQGGFKHGEIMLLAAGRQTGKSMLNQMFRSMTKRPDFQIYAQAQWAGATWYTVDCSSRTADWVRTQDKELWLRCYDHAGVDPLRFGMHEKLYTLLALKWS